ncbi:MAG: hypothetical protein ACSHYB_19505 [Roseibacillus sp.]
MKTLPILFLVPALLQAESRTSTNYTLVQETTTEGYGQRSSSTNYTLDDSGHGGAVASSTSYTHRDGFAGQLLDPALLTITGASSVSEHITRDLDADLVYDDGTTELDAPVIWSINSGPLASVSASGLVTPQTVYQNTAAWVRADYQGLSDLHRIVVVDFLKDNFESYGSDGIPDSWQISNFGLPPNNDASPAENPDGDPWDNLSEYLTGYDPTDPLSFLCFEITEIDSQVTFELSKMVPGTKYTLFESSDLGQTELWAATSETTVSVELPNVTTPKAEIEIPNMGQQNLFFRLEVSPDE